MGATVGSAFAPLFAARVSAVHACGARALIVGAGEAYRCESGDERTCCVEYAPFSRVYPRCAAVMHHGGSGTLAQSLRAGVPTLVVPWGADQFFHGALLQRLGAGLALARRGYTEARARLALGVLLGEGRFREAASGIAARIAQEDGVAVLCERVESELARAR